VGHPSLVRHLHAQLPPDHDAVDDQQDQEDEEAGYNTESFIEELHEAEAHREYTMLSAEILNETDFCFAFKCHFAGK
jgi:hypothetical protein